MPPSSKPTTTATAAPTTAAPALRRRESARALIHRLHATPVQLFPRGRDNAARFADESRAPTAGVRTELGPSSLCLVTSTTSTSCGPSARATDGHLMATAAAAVALGDYVYVMAAAHTLLGGRVLFFCGPATASFSLASFALQVERQWLVGTQAAAAAAAAVPSTSAESTSKARQRAVMDAVARVDVLTCATMSDVYAVCCAYTFPTADLPSGAQTLHASLSGGHGADSTTGGFPPRGEATTNGATRDFEVLGAGVIPLCVVWGLTGPTSATTLQERATGQSTPVPHYLLCLLQRRVQCALVVVEAPASVVEGLSDTRFNGPTAATAAPPSAASVLSNSDLVRRLQQPHEHDTSHPQTRSFGVGVDGGRFSAVRRSEGKIPRAGMRQMEGERGGLLLQTLPPVSLHNIHFSVVCVEAEHVEAQFPSSSTVALPWRTPGTIPGQPYPSLISPYRLPLRYRLHFMHTTAAEPIATGRSGGGSGGAWGSAPWQSRSFRRTTTSQLPVFSGVWTLSLDWHEL